MKFSRILLAAVLLMSLLPSCRSQYEQLLTGTDVDAKYKAAFELFNKGKYTKAAGMFESMSILTNGTPQDDTVQFYWALSNYRSKDYYTAQANFKSFRTLQTLSTPRISSTSSPAAHSRRMPNSSVWTASTRAPTAGSSTRPRPMRPSLPYTSIR